MFQSKKTVPFENIGLLDIGDCFSKDQKFEFCLNVNVCVYQWFPYELSEIGKFRSSCNKKRVIGIIFINRIDNGSLISF